MKTTPIKLNSTQRQYDTEGNLITFRAICTFCEYNSKELPVSWSASQAAAVHRSQNSSEHKNARAAIAGPLDMNPGLTHQNGKVTQR